MPFKVLIMAHAPDANGSSHRTEVKTGMLEAYLALTGSQQEAVEVAREYHREKVIDSILLCPGFTHRDAAGLFDSLNGEVAVAVARGDGPSGRISAEALRRSGFFE